jgi:GTP-binding protein EngB required for normal cell division
MNNLEQIKDAVGMGRTVLALKLLKDFCIQKNDIFFLDQCHGLDARYHQLKNDEIYGVDTKAEQNRSLNSINKAILELVNDLKINILKQSIVERKAEGNVYDGKSGEELLESDKVKIAMAGQPNVGKTTLIRNIFKNEIGVIGDASNVTVSSYLKEHDDLGIAFIDCPGFNEPGRVVDWLQFTKSEEEFSAKLKELDLAEDLSAYKGIKKADVIYYVVSVMTVPNKGDRSLLQLVSKVNPNVIGIINMGFHLGKSEPEKSKKRIEQWEVFFIDNGIKSIIEYDFAWDRPTKIHDLFRETLKFVNSEKRIVLSKSLNKMLHSYKEGSEDIAIAIKNLINECKRINHSLVLETEEEHKAKESTIKAISEKIQVEIQYSFQPVLQKIKILYQNDTLSQNLESGLNEEQRTLKSSFSKKFDQILEGAGIGGAIGVYGTLKALLVGAATGGPIGIAVIAIAGGLFGLFSKSRISTTKIDLSLSNSDIYNLLEKTIQILWISANKGYGIGSNISENELLKLVEGQCSKLISRNGITPETIKNSDISENLKKLVLNITMPE